MTAIYCVSPASQRRRMSVKGVGSRRDAPRPDMLRNAMMATSPQHLKAFNDLHTLSVGVRKPVRIFDAQSKGYDNDQRHHPRRT